MTSGTFRTRYTRAAEKHSHAPIAFVSFDRALLIARNVREEDADLLVEIGLPADDPFLQFQAYAAGSLDERLCFLGDPPGLYLLGEAGPSAFVAIDTRSGSILRTCYNPETLVFINSSLRRLMDTLCLFNEHVEPGGFVRELEQLDFAAARPGAFWRELSDDLAALCQ